MAKADNEMMLNYETLGNKDHPAVVLVHGLFGDLDNLKSISRALADDYFVINLDVRNHGQSPWHDEMPFAEMADDVLAVLDKEQIKTAHFLGHSMGGKIVMEIALTHGDRVDSLIVADIAPVAYDARHTTIIDALEAVTLAQVESRQDADKQLAESIQEKGVRQFLLKNLRKDDDGWSWRMNLKALKHCYADLIGAPGAEGSYDGPVLFIRGGNSDYIQASHRDTIIKRFPHAQSKTIEGAGHWLHAEKPTVFNGLVQRFLDENRS